jgi:hypothetical protein
VSTSSDKTPRYPVASDKRTPDNDRVHYCRDCTETFESTDRESAHRAALIHHIREHDQLARFQRCNRYCPLRAQNEELEAGRRLYGPDVERVLTRRQYEEIWSDHDDHA